VSAEGVTLSGVLWNTKLCTDTTLESPIQLGAEGAKMADRAIPISQAKGQGQEILVGITQFYWVIFFIIYHLNHIINNKSL